MNRGLAAALVALASCSRCAGVPGSPEIAGPGAVAPSPPAPAAPVAAAPTPEHVPAPEASAAGTAPRPPPGESAPVAGPADLPPGDTSPETMAGWDAALRREAPGLPDRVTVLAPSIVWHGKKLLRVAPGTLLAVGAAEGERVPVLLPDGQLGTSAACQLSRDEHEVGVARALVDLRAAQAAGRAEEAERIIVSARADHPKARLQPLLEGRAAPADSCEARPQKPQARVAYLRREPLPSPGGLEVLGEWTSNQEDVVPPRGLDFRMLADLGPPLRSTEPLAPDVREDARRLRIEQAVFPSEGDEPRAELEFRRAFSDVPAAERGVLYALHAGAFHPIPDEDVTAIGHVVLSVDCHGCEDAPRRYAGGLRVDLHGRASVALIARFPGHVGFGPVRPVPGAVGVQLDEEGGFTVPLAGGDGTLLATAAKTVDRTGHDLFGKIVRAYVADLDPGSIPILVIETLSDGSGMCDRAIWAYLVEGPVLRSLSGGRYDCHT